MRKIRSVTNYIPNVSYTTKAFQSQVNWDPTGHRHKSTETTYKQGNMSVLTKNPPWILHK